MAYESSSNKTGGGAVDLKKIEYQKKIEARLRELDARIKKLQAETARATADVVAESKEHLRKLKAGREEMSAQLDKLKKSSEDAWVDLKLGMDNILGEIKTTLASAASRFDIK